MNVVFSFGVGVALCASADAAMPVVAIMATTVAMAAALIQESFLRPSRLIARHPPSLTALVT